MIALLLQVVGVAGIGLLFAVLVRDGEKRYRARVAAMRQASWDAHVADAVRASENPVYERLAHELVVDLDAEWRTASTKGWATP